MPSASVNINRSRAGLCRRSFAAFVRQFWNCDPLNVDTPLVWNWHLDVLCNELQEAAERVFRGEPRPYDLVINVPPGTSKSTIISVHFPAWCWTRMPNCRILTASHTSNLTLDLAGRSRDVVMSKKYKETFEDISVREDTNAKGHYRNKHGGERRTATVSGVHPVGFHGHVVIIDDPIDPEDVLSEARLQTAKQFVEQDIISRKVDKEVALTVLIMQRLGLGDPTDVMLKAGSREGAIPVRHICLPAEIFKGEDGTWLETAVSPQELAKNYTDGLLDTKRLNRRVLDDFKSRGELYYATQFLQRPYAPKGGMFHEEYFNNRVRAAPLNARRVRYWDRACLVAGTRILVCRNGEVAEWPIEAVQAGDLVYDRKGTTRKVKRAWRTKLATELTTIRCANGFSLTGTPDHLVWTESGWWELGKLDMKEASGVLTIGLAGKGRCELWTTHVEPTPVYDLEVEDSHEFFANGILVHNSTQDGGCYTAGVLLAKDSDGCYYIEDVVHGQWEPGLRNRMMRATALKDRSRYGPRNEPTIWVEAEGGSSGRDAWLGVVRALDGFPVFEHQVSRMGSKDVRAEPWSAQLAAGNVKVVDNGESEHLGRAQWDVDGYVSEHLSFRQDPTRIKRTGGLKDRVDASSGAYACLANTRPAPDLRVYKIGGDKRKHPRLVACSLADLADLDFDAPAILVKVISPVCRIPVDKGNDFDELKEQTAKMPLEGVEVGETPPYPHLVIDRVPTGVEMGVARVCIEDNQVADAAEVVTEARAGQILAVDLVPTARDGTIPPPEENKQDENAVDETTDKSLAAEVIDRIGKLVDNWLPATPTLPFNNCVDERTIVFADLDPDDLQATWHEPLLPYNKLPTDLVMTREHGKQFWAFLLKKRPTPPEVIVVADEGKTPEGGKDRRAQSLTVALAECYGLKPEAVWRPDGGTEQGTNKHVVSVIKITRGAVIG